MVRGHDVMLNQISIGEHCTPCFGLLLMASGRWGMFDDALCALAQSFVQEMTQPAWGRTAVFHSTACQHTAHGHI